MFGRTIRKGEKCANTLKFWLSRAFAKNGCLIYQQSCRRAKITKNVLELANSEDSRRSPEDFRRFQSWPEDLRRYPKMTQTLPKIAEDNPKIFENHPRSSENFRTGSERQQIYPIVFRRSPDVFITLILPFIRPIFPQYGKHFITFSQ